MATKNIARVTCINKPNRNSPVNSITHIGDASGKIPAAQAIRNILGGQWEYFTHVGGKRAEVGVNGPAGRQYLQTHADGTWNNNLLALDECA